jgi:hypothetical protein
MAKEYPETVEEMLPLYQAAWHGFRASRHQSVLDDIIK